MIKQKWCVTLDGEKHCVGYVCSPVSGKTILSVDGSDFTVKGKPFGIGLMRCEPIIVGNTQAMLDIAKGGKAKLVCREGTVEEIL